MTNRTLNDSQHRALDRIANQHPTARVIGWDEKMAGPLVSLPDGSAMAVAPTGRLRNPTDDGVAA